MKITLLCVGKVKEAFYRDAVAEYLKRLSRYAEVCVIEVADERTKEQPTEAERGLVLAKEGERLLKYMERFDKSIALAIEGKTMDSVRFSEQLQRLMDGGCGHLGFIIGGSLGLSKTVLDRSDAQVSFSEMTFPHQLMRVILAEQIYRGFRIMKGEPYHK